MVATLGSLVAAGLCGSSPPFPPIGIALTTKPGDPRQDRLGLQEEGFFRENEARASEGYRLF